MFRLFSSPRIVTNPTFIDDILTRSVAGVLPSKAALKEILLSGRRLRVYVGADATGPELHLGHSTNFILLEKLRRLGHEVIILFGDFTAMIGDPSDKDAARKPLSKAEVDEHIKTWKSQVAPIVKLSGENPARIAKNSTWLSKLSFADVLSLASNFTVQHMLERDMFDRRMKDGKPVHLHEFLYPLMQGYDSVALDVDIEIGGTDQTFNMLAGRILERRIKGKEKFVVATTLLTDPKTGKKLMSKSEGNYVALSDAPETMYGKIMALPDEAVPQLFTDCTLVPLERIDRIVGGHPRDAKRELAREVVALYHGASAAEKASRQFGTVEQGKEITVDMPASLAELLLKEGLIASKSEFKRLLSERALVRAQDGKVITSATADVTLTGDLDLRVGKHRFLRIRKR